MAPLAVSTAGTPAHTVAEFTFTVGVAFTIICTVFELTQFTEDVPLTVYIVFTEGVKTILVEFPPVLQV